MSIQLKNITITLKQTIHKNTTYNKVLLENFNLNINKGEVFTIMGSSGSGKSTLLNYLTGVIDNNAFNVRGEVIVNGRHIEHLPSYERKIGLLSQEGLLFPHMTVEENLLYALPYKITSKEKKELVRKTLENTQLEFQYASLYPYALSGGQQSRLALARTILSRPEFLLLDEPFSKLDTDLRVTIRSWVENVIKKNNIPTLLVTHDKSDIYDNNLIYTIAQ